ncbi:MAG: methyltransferase domain-containing protein [Deltaproteobacteria bacterium]|nr:methyltransferase domain-containing protein [Deltaproteobacteria bacterium]
MSVLGENGLQTTKLCPVCSGRPVYLFNRKYTLTGRSNRETEKILGALGIKEINSEFAVCLNCFHIHRYPLFDETSLFKEGIKEISEAVYQKYPEERKKIDEITLKPLLHSTSHILFYAHTLIESLLRITEDSKVASIKILDWGGGDGSISGSMGLVLNKKLFWYISDKVNVYIHDLQPEYNQQRAREDYIEYIGHADLAKKAPYDLMIFSHVFEHTADPLRHLKEQVAFLQSHGSVLIIIPYEQNVIFKPSNTAPRQHQHMFSAASVCTLMKNAGLSHVRVDIKKQLAGQDWIIAAGSKGKGKTRLTLYKFQSTHLLFKYFFKRVLNLIKRVFLGES